MTALKAARPAPDLHFAASPDVVARLRAHPAFPEAARTMMRDVIGIYQGNRLLNQVLNDRGRVVFAALALYLHYTRIPDDPGGGLSPARMKALCVETGLCSAGRAAAMLLLMRYAGYLEVVAEDKREDRLIPTKRMLESQRERLACHLKAMSSLMPEGIDGLAHLQRESFLAAMARQFGSSFLAGFRILDFSPDLYSLAERNAGVMILFSLVLASDDTTSEPVPMSIAAIARRFGVSRPHVLKLLRDAENSGLVIRQEDQIVVKPALANAIHTFIATVFLFVAQCVRSSLEEVG